jgi:DNA-binding LacI/PurR family transcriptional regulator
VEDILSQLSVNPKMHISLAHQLKQQITWLIASGELKSGDELPSLRQVARHLSVNLLTVRNAYKLLENEGIVKIRQGRETQVLSIDPRRMLQLTTSVKTNTVGVIVASLANPFYHSFLHGLSEEADNDQTLLFVCSSQNEPTEAQRYLIQLAAKQVDGIIIASQNIEDFLYDDRLPSHGQLKTLPLVAVDSPNFSGPVVLLDLKDAGYQATKHLITHGHQRIGLITYIVDFPNVSPVIEGYYQALQEAGIHMDPSLVTRVRAFDIAAGAEGAHWLASLARPPTAIFAITDLMAAGAMQTLKSIGYRIPEDIALVGFNDIPLAVLLDPPLTTVSAPSYEMGKAAMRMLKNQIAGKHLSHQRIILPVSLVVRQSCGCHTDN